MGGIDSKTISCLHFDEDYNILDDAADNKWSSIGNPRITSAQKKIGNSLYLDGSSYISMPHNNKFDFGANDFTVEWWEYRTVGNNSSIVFSNAQMGKYVGITIGQYYQGNNLCFASTVNSTTHDILNQFNLGSVDLNKWNHFALVRKINTFYGFKNGVLTSTATSSLSIGADTSFTITLGIIMKGGTYFSGYLDEIRISNTARYTANFTPQTTAFEIDSNTLSLLHFDTLYKAKDEINSNTWNSVGALTNSNQIYKFNKSLYFDGNSYLNIPYNDKFNFSINDFTVDWWEYRTNLGNSSSVRPTVLAHEYGTYDYDHGFIIGLSSNNNNICYMSSVSGAGWDILDRFNLGSVDLNKWNHFALVRKGNTFYGFKNGTLTSTATSNLSIYVNDNVDLLIGSRDQSASGGCSFYGYIDEFRISNIARWTSNFTPSSIPYLKQDKEVYKNNSNTLYGYK